MHGQEPYGRTGTPLPESAELPQSYGSTATRPRSTVRGCLPSEAALTGFLCHAVSCCVMLGRSTAHGVQADVKALLPNVSMLFCDPEDIQDTDGATGTAPAADGPDIGGKSASEAKAHVGKLAAGLENLALSSCGKLRKREERELHALGQAFRNDPAARTLRKEVQSRARQVRPPPAMRPPVARGRVFTCHGS